MKHHNSSEITVTWVYCKSKHYILFYITYNKVMEIYVSITTQQANFVQKNHK